MTLRELACLVGACHRPEDMRGKQVMSLCCCRAYVAICSAVDDTAVDFEPAFVPLSWEDRR